MDPTLPVSDERLPVEPPATVRPRFSVLHQHAEGGLGRVHLARDKQLHRTVALKEIRPERADDPHVRARFLAEAEITGQLEHPGIVPIYALEHDEAGRPVYAMRFIQGRTLGEAIRAYHERPTPLGLRELLQRFIAVCQTIAYAHSKRVLHRDLKPQNVMLGDYGETLVVDWGLAKRFGGEEMPRPGTAVPSVEDTSRGDAQTVAYTSGPEDRRSADRTDEMTREGAVLGTPAYMPPEQAGGQSVGPAADIYSLGAILYEILTGQAPYRGRTAEDVLRQVLVGPPPPLAGRTPRPLAAICSKALARQPVGRYTTAAELARDVERWLADEAVTAYREPFLARLGRWTRRNRTIVATAVALLLATTIAVIVSIVLLGRAKTLTEEALAKVTEQEKETKKALAQVTEKEKETTRALQGERKAREQAIDAFGVLANEVQQRLVNVPNMQDMRLELLKTAISGLDAIVVSVEDPATKRTIFTRADFNILLAYTYLADINLQIGNPLLAREKYEQGLRIIENGLKNTPDSPALLRYRALMIGRLGDMKLTIENDSTGTLDYYQKAYDDLEAALQKVKVQGALPGEHQGNSNEILRTLRAVSSALAAIYADQGKPARVLEQHKKSDQIQREIEKDIEQAGGALTSPDRLDRLRLALLMASTAWQLGDSTRAQNRYETTLKEIEELARQNKTDTPRFAIELSEGRGAYAEFLLRQKQYPEARKMGELALEYARERAAIDPRNANAQRYHAMCLFRLGVIEDRAGKPDKAQEYYRQCLTIRRKLLDGDRTNLSRQLDLMLALARVGQRDEAARIGSLQRPGAEKKPYALIMIACGYACCAEALVKGRMEPLTLAEKAERQRYILAAMEALEAAAKLGYASPIALETEEDLAGLFDEPAFRSFITQMRENADR
jgi:serine/threonine protein kinase